MGYQFNNESLQKKLEEGAKQLEGKSAEADQSAWLDELVRRHPWIKDAAKEGGSTQSSED